MPDSSVPVASTDPKTEQANVAMRTAMFDAQVPEDKLPPFKEGKDLTSLPASQQLSVVLKDPNFKGLPEQERGKVIDALLSKDTKFQALPKEEQGKVRSKLVGGQTEQAKPEEPGLLSRLVDQSAPVLLGKTVALGKIATDRLKVLMTPDASGKSPLDQEKERREKAGEKTDMVSMWQWAHNKIKTDIFGKDQPETSVSDLLGNMWQSAKSDPVRFGKQLLEGAVAHPEYFIGGPFTAVSLGVTESMLEQMVEKGQVSTKEALLEGGMAVAPAAVVKTALKLGHVRAVETKGAKVTPEADARAEAKVASEVQAGTPVHQALDNVLASMGVEPAERAKLVTDAKETIDAQGDKSGQVLPEAKGEAGQVERGKDMPSIDRTEPQDRAQAKEQTITELRDRERRILTGVDEIKGEAKYEELRNIARQLREQGGQVDPKLLRAMGLVGLGAVGGLLYEQDPKGAMEGALLAGGVLAGGALLSKAGRSLSTVYNKLAQDTRYRIDHLTEPYFGAIAGGELANYRFAEMLKTMVKDPNRREAMTHAIQSGDYSGLSDAEKSAAKTVAQGFDAMGKLGQEHDILPEDLLSNYVTQLWVPGLNSKESLISNLKRAMGQRSDLSPGRSPKSRFALHRSIPNYKAGIEAGLVPVTTDIAEIFRIYSNNINRAIQNKKFLTALKNERNPAGQHMLMLDRPKLIEAVAKEDAEAAAEAIGLPEAGKEMMGKIAQAQAPREYIYINHPQLRAYKVHPDVAPPLRALFEASDPNAATRAALAVSVAAKRGLFSFSLFHAKSLLDAMLGTSPSGWKHVPGALKALKQGQPGDVVDQLVRAGLRVVDKPLEADASAFSHALKLIEQRNPTIALPAKGIRWMQEKMDNFLWGVVHPSFKIASAMAAYEKGLRTRPKVPREQVARDVVSFVNDTFGGIDWFRIADDVQNKYGRNIALAIASPSGRRFMQIAMLAPDWTVATTRAMLKAVPGVSKPEIAAMHRAYVLRSAIVYLTVGDALNMAFSGHHLWQNEDPTMVDMGDGRRMQLSKHFMEPIHWLTKPGQQAVNKLGYVPREALEQIFGKDYFVIKGGQVGGPPIGGPMDRLEHAFKTPLPITLQNLVASPEAAVGGVLGVPIYGKTEEQAVDAAIERALQAGKSPQQAESRTRAYYRKKRKEQEVRNQQ